jgi:hypothetical protein
MVFKNRLTQWPKNVLKNRKKPDSNPSTHWNLVNIPVNYLIVHWDIKNMTDNFNRIY